MSCSLSPFVIMIGLFNLGPEAVIFILFLSFYSVLGYCSVLLFCYGYCDEYAKVLHKKEIRTFVSSMGGWVSKYPWNHLLLKIFQQGEGSSRWFLGTLWLQYEVESIPELKNPSFHLNINLIPPNSLNPLNLKLHFFFLVFLFIINLPFIFASQYLFYLKEPQKIFSLRLH